MTIGGICVAIFILYAGIWSPLQNHVDDMRKQVVTGQSTLQFMQSAQKQIAESGNEQITLTSSLSPVDFLSYFQEKLNKTGLSSAVTQMKQASDDTITVSFKQVEFDRLMRLLLTVTKEQRVTIEQMTTTADVAPGVASVELVLKLK